MCTEIGSKKKCLEDRKPQIFLTDWADTILKNKNFENDLRVVLSG